MNHLENGEQIITGCPHGLLGLNDITTEIFDIFLRNAQYVGNTENHWPSQLLDYPWQPHLGSVLQWI